MSSIEYKYNTKTEGQTKVHTITWIITDFITFLENTKNRELRPKISNEPIAEASDSRFQVKMQFLGRTNRVIDIYYLSPSPVLIKVVLACDSNYNKRLLIDSHYHTVRPNRWQYLHSLTWGDIELRFDKALSLQFEFFDIKVEQTNSPEVRLINDFESLLNNGLFHDVTMKSADGVEYKVHKVVLASRSAVLKAHFEHNTIECATNIVESPLESELLREVLTFIYSGKAPRIDEIPEKLFAAANYYQLSDLISLCEESIQNKLTVENAIETIQLAELHSANALKQLTLEFIKDEPASLITKTEGWAKLNSVELIKEIFEYITADDVHTH